ncbi:DUF7024 domain-containing protein [Escherichia coli]
MSESCWSNAQLGDEVKIEYKIRCRRNFDPLSPPKHTAITPAVGFRTRRNEEQTLVLGNEVTTTTLHFDNPTDADTLVIALPNPSQPTKGVSSDTRRVVSRHFAWWKLKAVDVKDNSALTWRSHKVLTYNTFCGLQNIIEKQKKQRPAFPGRCMATLIISPYQERN